MNKGGRESPKGFKAPGSGRAAGQPGDGGGALPGERTTSINHRPYDDGPLVEALLISPSSHTMASPRQSGPSQGCGASHAADAGPLDARARRSSQQRPAQLLLPPCSPPLAASRSAQRVQHARPNTLSSPGPLSLASRGLAAHPAESPSSNGTSLKHVAHEDRSRQANIRVSD